MTDPVTGSVGGLSSEPRNKLEDGGVEATAVSVVDSTRLDWVCGALLVKASG